MGNSVDAHLPSASGPGKVPPKCRAVIPAAARDSRADGRHLWRAWLRRLAI